MLADGIRIFWLPQISELTGALRGTVPKWVGEGQYYFADMVSQSRATFVLKPGDSLLGIFGSEMSRFSSASVETSLGIARAVSPKSTAWLLIQTYYAAFYAAHSILRAVGVSLSNLKAHQCARADAIAAALGFLGTSLAPAQFRCEYHSGSDSLVCAKANGAGIHDQFWRAFDSFLGSTATALTTTSLLIKSEALSASAMLLDLRDILRRGGHSGGNWLSNVRNEVTYMQEHKAWFPYGRTKAECDRLFEIQRQWRLDPEKVILIPSSRNEIELFVSACAFLVAFSVAITKDMANRCPSGVSFLRSGPLRLLSENGIL